MNHGDTEARRPSDLSQRRGERREAVSFDRMRAGLTSANPVVRGLFQLRAALGRWFGWDDEEPAPDSGTSVAPIVPVVPVVRAAPAESYMHRLTTADREASLEPPGSKDGPFTVLYVFADESVSEIRNATVHAFSAMVFERSTDGYVAWWAIYVKPVGRGTRFYMALIDPFRRQVIYPALVRRFEEEWRTKMETGR